MKNSIVALALISLILSSGCKKNTSPDQYSTTEEDTLHDILSDAQNKWIEEHSVPTPPISDFLGSDGLPLQKYDLSPPKTALIAIDNL